MSIAYARSSKTTRHAQLQRLAKLLKKRVEIQTQIAAYTEKLQTAFKERSDEFAMIVKARLEELN